MKHYYAKDWNMGLAVNSSGEDYCKTLRFNSKADRDFYVANYDAPNHCPSAFAEVAKASEVRSVISDAYWVFSECGTYEIAR